MADIKYHAELAAWQKALIALVLVVVAVIAVIFSLPETTLGLEVFGLFVTISGTLLLSLALVRTNDDLLAIAQHPKKKDMQDIVTHLATERFQIMLALFLMVLGFLLQMFGIIF